MESKVKRFYTDKKKWDKQRPFNPNKHILGDDLFEQVMDYYNGKVAYDVMSAIFTEAWFRPKTVDFRIQDRQRVGALIRENCMLIRVHRFDMADRCYS